MQKTGKCIVDAPEGYKGPDSDAWFFGDDLEPPFTFASEDAPPPAEPESKGAKALPAWAYAEVTNGGVRFLRRADDDQWVLVNAAEKQLAVGPTPMAALTWWQTQRGG